MTPEQEAQLYSAIGKYTVSFNNPCGVAFYYDANESKPWRIADDHVSESFATFDELLNAANEWRAAFDNA